MRITDKDRTTLEHMLNYCKEIEETMYYFGADYQIFQHHKIYRNAIVLCILQIGELVTHFTDEFRAEYTEIKWNEVKGLRNIIAHRYGTVNPEQIWKIIQDDIPVLEEYCKKILGHPSRNLF